MKQPMHEAWITLNASYGIDPHCHPDELLEDASLWLDGAHGVTQSLSALLIRDVDVNPDDLANALWGVATLIRMGQRNSQEAHTRLKIKRGK
jgi:hypothetical protein